MTTLEKAACLTSDLFFQVWACGNKCKCLVTSHVEDHVPDVLTSSPSIPPTTPALSPSQALRRHQLQAARCPVLCHLEQPIFLNAISCTHHSIALSRSTSTSEMQKCKEAGNLATESRRRSQWKEYMWLIQTNCTSCCEKKHSSPSSMLLAPITASSPADISCFTFAEHFTAG